MDQAPRTHIFDIRWKVAATLFVVFSVLILAFSFFSHTLVTQHDHEETREFL